MRRCHAARSVLETCANPTPGRSTTVDPPGWAKTLSSRVRPGLLETFASPVVPASALSSEDFPTLDRPMTATSVTVYGRSSSDGAEVTKRNDSGAATQAYRTWQNPWLQYP